MSCNTTWDQLQSHLHFHAGKNTLQSSREHISPTSTTFSRTQVKCWKIYKGQAPLPHTLRVTEGILPSPYSSLTSKPHAVLPKIFKNPYCNNLTSGSLMYISIFIRLELRRKKKTVRIEALHTNRHGRDQNIHNRAVKRKPKWLNLLLAEGRDERDCPEDTRSV